MKTHFIALTIAAASATAAHAAPEYYAGISFATFDGENDYGGSEYEIEGDVPEIFVGADWDMGSYMLGAELSIVAGQVFETGYEDSYQYAPLVDLKGRVGYEMGAFTPYGVLGFSFGTFEFGSSNDSEEIFGVVAGVGATYDITDQFSVGAELLARRIDLYEGETIGNVQSASLRGIYNF